MGAKCFTSVWCKTSAISIKRGLKYLSPSIYPSISHVKHNIIVSEAIPQRLNSAGKKNTNKSTSHICNDLKNHSWPLDGNKTQSMHGEPILFRQCISSGMWKRQMRCGLTHAVWTSSLISAVKWCGSAKSSSGSNSEQQSNILATEFQVISYYIFFSNY